MRNETICRLPELRPSLEYIPLRTDPARGLSMPGLPNNDLRMAEEGPGPLMGFVLSLGGYLTAGAMFAAFALMLMVAVA